MEHFIGSSMHVWIGWCLSEVMEADGPFPSVVTYGSAVAALRRGGHWQHALQLLERAQDQKVGAFWEIEVLTVLAFSISFHTRNIRQGKTGVSWWLLCGYLLGCLYSWMNEGVMILNATCWCTMGSNHKAFSNLRSYSWWTKMWLTSISSNIPNWCKVSAINNIKPCDLKLEIVGVFSHPK